MRKIISCLLILGLSFLACVSAGVAESGVSYIPLTLYPAYLQTPLDMPVVLDAETYPAGQRLTWSSSVPSIATVDWEGCVTPVSPGETAITCALADQPDVTATCGVLVVAEGDILLWAYPPEPMDLDAIIAEMEAEYAANPPEAPEVPWPDTWPDAFPKIEGKVTLAYGDSPESENGLFVTLTDTGLDTAKAYVSTLVALGLKANDYSREDNYCVLLKGNEYEIIVMFDLNSLECKVMMKK
ncbi:MAG: Ig-like domain-containing protein [Clostridia bacterium]|nr:Ig-like domain-containing protein [Clostridia bacterium]